MNKKGQVLQAAGFIMLVLIGFFVLYLVNSSISAPQENLDLAGNRFAEEVEVKKEMAGLLSSGRTNDLTHNAQEDWDKEQVKEFQEEVDDFFVVKKKTYGEGRGGPGRVHLGSTKDSLENTGGHANKGVYYEGSEKNLDKGYFIRNFYCNPSHVDSDYEVNVSLKTVEGKEALLYYCVERRWLQDE